MTLEFDGYSDVKFEGLIRGLYAGLTVFTVFIWEIEVKMVRPQLAGGIAILRENQYDNPVTPRESINKSGHMAKVIKRKSVRPTLRKTIERVLKVLKIHSHYDSESNYYDITVTSKFGHHKVLISPEESDERLMILMPYFGRFDLKVDVEKKAQVLMELLEFNRKVWLVKLSLDPKDGEVRLSVELPLINGKVDSAILKRSLLTVFAVTVGEYEKLNNTLKSTRHD